MYAMLRTSGMSWHKGEHQILFLLTYVTIRSSDDSTTDGEGREGTSRYAYAFI